MKKLYQVLVVIDDFADTPQLHKPHGALDTARYPSCATRAPSAGRWTKLRNGKDMKTLRAHGFNQRPL